MRIAILTSGGDCPGLNAVIRGVVRTAANRGATVIGYEDGWQGLVEDRRIQLYDDEHIDRILLRGGTILGTGRLKTEKFKASLDRIKENLADAEIDVLIAIGGEGTLKGAQWLHDNGIPVVGVPKTIDNDVNATDYTFGFDTAVAVATDAIDRLHTTAESHNRVMIVQVMGRHVGWIALHAGMAGGAHDILIPEVPFDIDDVCRRMARRFQLGEKYGIIVVAEGALPAEGTMEIGERAIGYSATRSSTTSARRSPTRSRTGWTLTCARLCSVTSSVVVPRQPSTGCWPPAMRCTPPRRRCVGTPARWSPCTGRRSNWSPSARRSVTSRWCRSTVTSPQRR